MGSIALLHRSMVGRRALGQIDEILKQAKGNDREWFGGINVILVGTRDQRLSVWKPGLTLTLRCEQATTGSCPL